MEADEVPPPTEAGVESAPLADAGAVEQVDGRPAEFGGRPRGRGGRGGGRGRGGFGGRSGGGGGFNRGREYDRRSGSATTGVKPVEKREGFGAHNWGNVRDDIEGQQEPVDAAAGQPSAAAPAAADDWADAVEQEQQEANAALAAARTRLRTSR
ncbi:hypothetical protein BOX15_Mlig012353g1 [Macrostomum lignano]|uniref:Hyaluronan/mRNA-binding protein domain-containing protein n=1 Tax=Macrostomum lignano TaxID=282301 RepID=A0A267DBN2_9PLAT|nr:hypothetical protein BOX15_Mlig012353g1 [Macrostomum lignano]